MLCLSHHLSTIPCFTYAFWQCVYTRNLIWNSPLNMQQITTNFCSRKFCIQNANFKKNNFLEPISSEVCLILFSFIKTFYAQHLTYNFDYDILTFDFNATNKCLLFTMAVSLKTFRWPLLSLLTGCMSSMKVNWISRLRSLKGPVVTATVFLYLQLKAYDLV